MPNTKFLTIKTIMSTDVIVNIDQISSINSHGALSRIVLKEIKDGNSVEFIALQNPYYLQGQIKRLLAEETA
jgi:hypothetical protein